MNKQNQARWWVDARWQDKLAGSSVSLDDVRKWSVIVIAWCEEVRYSSSMPMWWKIVFTVSYCAAWMFHMSTEINSQHYSTKLLALRIHSCHWSMVALRHSDALLKLQCKTFSRRVAKYPMTLNGVSGTQKISSNLSKLKLKIKLLQPELPPNLSS